MYKYWGTYIELSNLQSLPKSLLSSVCWEKEGEKDGQGAGVFQEDKVANAMSSGTIVS